MNKTLLIFSSFQNIWGRPSQYYEQCSTRALYTTALHEQCSTGNEKTGTGTLCQTQNRTTLAQAHCARVIEQNKIAHGVFNQKNVTELSVKVGTLKSRYSDEVRGKINRNLVYIEHQRIVSTFHRFNPYNIPP